jgi:hypothetical protein
VTVRTPLLLVLALATGCSAGGTPAAAARQPGQVTYQPSLYRDARPQTRAERSDFRETSSYQDVITFIDSLAALGAPIHVGSIGKSGEGRDIPYVVASRPLVRTPAEARRLNRPIVYVQGNIHGGEVEGKEALQSLLRDLTRDPRRNVLDSIVLVAVPIYNADGNEQWGPQARQRGSQQGPELVGQRPNAAGLDLNRDYIKAVAPETRASLAMFNAWDPDVFVDLHTTNGSLHGYALTYSPSLNQAAILTQELTRDLLAQVRQRMADVQGFRAYDYGNFSASGREAELTDPANRDTIAWATYDSRPRFGTNYYGLRGRIAILSEAYSHDPFQVRVASTYAFLLETLGLVGARGTDVLDNTRGADRRTTGWGTTVGSAPELGLRSRLLSNPPVGPVLVEVVERVADTLRTEAGLRPGVRRTGEFRAVPMRIVDRFEPTLRQSLPFAYAFSAADRASILPLLQLHGVQVDELAADAQVTAQAFTVDSIARAPRPFQGHQEVLLSGQWGNPAPRALPAGTIVVRAGQPLGVLAFYLLEPQTDDGLVTWNALDALIATGRPFPIIRVTAPARLDLRDIR